MFNIKDLVNKVHNDEQDSLQALHLTAYENRMSRLAESFLSSPLSYRYTFGDNEDSVITTKTGLMLKGLPGVVALSKVAEELANRMFNAKFTLFRPTSGLHATICTLLATTNTGDLVYSIDPDDGGHFATKHLVEKMGRRSSFLPWDLENLTIDLNKFKEQIVSEKPKAIIFEHGTPLFNLPIKEIRSLVGDDILLIYDASHTLGLIAGGKFQDPLSEGCDILQGNTHKTFPGPQKGMIMFRDKVFGEKITSSILSGFISSMHTHHAIALYLTTLEMGEHGAAYAKQMLSNAQTLGKCLQELGFDLIKKGESFTTSHELLIKPKANKSHFDYANALFNSSINTNARVSFRQEIVRIGVQEVTRRGMVEKDMVTIAELFNQIISEKRDMKDQVQEFNKAFPNIYFSFDKELGLWN